MTSAERTISHDDDNGVLPEDLINTGGDEGVEVSTNTRSCEGARVLNSLISSPASKTNQQHYKVS